jgi:hypothetical protein
VEIGEPANDKLIDEQEPASSPSHQRQLIDLQSHKFNHCLQSRKILIERNKEKRESATFLVKKNTPSQLVALHYLNVDLITYIRMQQDLESSRQASGGQFWCE